MKIGDIVSVPGNFIFSGSKDKFSGIIEDIIYSDNPDTYPYYTYAKVIVDVVMKSYQIPVKHLTKL